MLLKRRTLLGKTLHKNELLFKKKKKRKSLKINAIKFELGYPFRILQAHTLLNVLRVQRNWFFFLSFLFQSGEMPLLT